MGPDPIVSPAESCPYRQRINAEALAQLDTMADGHMGPQIVYGDCWECETTQGEGFVVPGHVHPIPAHPWSRYTLEDDTPAEVARVLRALKQYTDAAGEVRSATVRRGAYLCRMSAPGYMDCTEWEAHDTAQAAADSLIQSFGDDA